MITKDEILMGRDKSHASEYTKEVSDNIDKLLIVLNKIRQAYGKAMVVSSGWRPPSLNATVANAAKRSLHTLGLACDFKDVDGSLDRWASDNQDLLESLGLWQEHPDHTPNWLHLDLGVRAIKARPNCKKRQFNP